MRFFLILLGLLVVLLVGLGFYGGMIEPETHLIEVPAGQVGNGNE